jgi:hypothetical protein
MRQDSEDLLETVIAAVMSSHAEPLALAGRLRHTVPGARVTALIRALLDADRVIGETFSGASPGRADARLARGFALTLAEAADEVEAERDDGTALTLADLLL